MKPRELTTGDLSYFAHITTHSGEYASTGYPDRERQLKMILAAAKAMVSGYTGIDLDKTELEDLSYAILTIGAEMLDNRQMTAEGAAAMNPTVMQILDLHATNLLPGTESGKEASENEAEQPVIDSAGEG